MKTDLLTVPGIGKNIKQDLIDIGIDCVEALRGQDRSSSTKRTASTRAASRTAASSTSYAVPSTMPTRPPGARPPDPQKCRWWYWKEHVYPSSDDTESLFPSTQVR